MGAKFVRRMLKRLASHITKTAVCRGTTNSHLLSKSFGIRGSCTPLFCTDCIFALETLTLSLTRERRWPAERVVGAEGVGSLVPRVPTYRRDAQGYGSGGPLRCKGETRGGACDWLVFWALFAQGSFVD